MKRKTIAAGMLVALCAGVQIFAGNWPAWRGPEGTGISREKNPPVNWGEKENMRWRVDLPGPGNSSPIVWGKRVFVSQAVPDENRRTVMCFDRADGKLLWQSGVNYEEREPTQQNNPYCAGTPATDGERVYVNFGSAGVYAYDMEGKEVWKRDLGKLNHVFGNAISPILYGDFCIMNFGPDEKARLVALDKKTGSTVWEAEPPKVDPSEQQQMARGPGGGGRGGFGPGTMLAPQMVAQADKNEDKKISKEEFSNLAESWYGKLDPEKSGKVGQEQFTEKFSELLPPPQGFGPGDGGPERQGGRGGGRGGFGPGRFAGPGIFTAADADKDGFVTQAELKGTFAKWASEWDADKAGSLNEEKIREGLNAALPRPNFGGPGGPGGGQGGRQGGPGGGRPGVMGPGSGASWSTPMVIKIGGRDELIVAFPNRVAAYDPKTGKQLWWSKGLGGTIYSSPAWGEGILVAASSGMGGANAVALRPGGNGEITESQRVWHTDRAKSSMGSGVISEGHLYTISQDGIAECHELKTGNKIWEERLKGPGARGSSWSSLLLADGKIYAPNQSGDVFVFRATPKFEVLATNSVNEPTNASLAASDGELFLRTNAGLWCFAKK